MKRNELSVVSVVIELVKNCIDAECTVIQIEFNGSFDLRVIDDGCGFDEQILQDIGERQLLLSNALQNHQLRYGKNGKSLFTISQITDEIYIESIKRNSDDRLYKTISAHKSDYKMFKADREYKEAMVKTSQGSMVVLSSIRLDIGDDIQLKMNIVHAVMELALINFKIDISVKDTATQQTLYESYRTKNLFDKFEHFLESKQFFSKIQSVSCQKHDVKVEILICEDGTSSKAFQFVYFNKLNDNNGKWTKIINKLCKKRFENDLNSKYPVYLMNIYAENYLENQLANNVIIDNCIKKCFEELSKPLSKSFVAKNDLAQRASFQDKSQFQNEDPQPEGDANIKEHTHRGVGLGDWIFNNSSENYEKLNQGKEMYRKKICENWVISLPKPKPKDTNDSLDSVIINNTQQDDHLFKKPLPRINRKTPLSKREKPKIKSLPTSLPLVSTQTYKPSHNVKAFDDSSLMRASRKLVLKAVDTTKVKKSKKNRIGSGKKGERKLEAKNSFENLNLLPMEIPISSPMLDISFENLNRSIGEINASFQPPDIEHKSNEHLQIYKSTKKMDFKLHKNEQTTNFNMNFSSSIAIHTINDTFMGFLENDVGEMHSISNLFETNVPSTNNISFRQSQPEFNHLSGSSVFSQVSQLHYRQHNNTIRTHYRHQTYCNFNNNNSLNSDRHEINSRVGKNRRTRSIQGSSNSATTVAPIGKERSSIGLINDEVRQSGWPVTININFGQSK